MLSGGTDPRDTCGVALQYTLTLSTLTEPGRTASAQTSWTLHQHGSETPIGEGVCHGDPHGDHARIEGRTAAKKHAIGLGLRITDIDVRTRYAAQPAAIPAPAAAPAGK